jgi:DNA-binding NtrC family response regulator
VLIVEPDREWRAHLRKTLRQMGFRVVEANDHSSARAAMRESTFLAVLSDTSIRELYEGESLDGFGHMGPQLVLLTHEPAQSVGGVLARRGVYYLPKMAPENRLALLLDALEADPQWGAVA